MKSLWKLIKSKLSDKPKKPMLFVTAYVCTGCDRPCAWLSFENVFDDYKLPTVCLAGLVDAADRINWKRACSLGPNE